MIKLINNLIPKEFVPGLFFVCLLSLVGVVFEIFSISLMLPLISSISDSSILKNTYILYFVNFLESINYFGIGILVQEETLKLVSAMTIFFVVRSIFSLIYVLESSKLIYGIERELAKKIYKNYLESDYLFFLKKNPSYLLRNVINETNQFALGIIGTIISLFTEIILIIFLLILAFMTNAIFTIFFFLFFLFTGSFFYVLTRKKLIEYGKIRLKAEGQKIKNVQEGFMSIVEIKIMNLINFFLILFTEQANKTVKVNIKYSFIKSLPKIILELIAIFFIFIIFFYSHFLSFNEKNILPLVAAFSIIFIRLLPSVSKIIVSFQSFNISKKSLETLNDIFFQEKNFCNKKKLKFNEDTFEKVNFNSHIEIKNISFSYQDDNGKNKNILSDLSLDIKKNKKIGIFGDSGSGKSTLLKILLGLIKPDKGDIVIDETKLSEKNIKSWQSKIGYVSQNTSIFDETLGFNITLNSNDYDKDYLAELLLKMNLERFTLNDIDTDNFEIGDKGSRISGGEKQRIGICRALYRKPEILILDEPTSSLDELTQKKILDDIFKMNNITIILVSHVLENFKHCDHLYKLENKTITKVK
jgi:ABC-type bacteriocin/lantibiotic exporter with double-glycine peptidase domain